MNIGLAFNPAAFAQMLMTQNNPAKAAQAAAIAGGTEFARDKMVKSSQRRRSMNLVGAQIGRKCMQKEAMKPAKAKRA
ncbi:MAG: hypothetical protein A2289_18030 [Deltaproteobacteria bacterium RIFOXYA12_FULL_58_15]|nr:MAG: hypothetical protein A2289_18030 [Deltaproteobacteria bacterium RIFOXYA12_FULL_58_15]OGR07087.1 MAG: hypothetical protein A2341_08100 [Deltaproteobacteria bacterium RIFOXYB12_FULL_58_9]